MTVGFSIGEVTNISSDKGIKHTGGLVDVVKGKIIGHFERAKDPNSNFAVSFDTGALARTFRLPSTSETNLKQHFERHGVRVLNPEENKQRLTIMFDRNDALKALEAIRELDSGPITPVTEEAKRPQPKRARPQPR
jgi:hypothetical protein